MSENQIGTNMEAPQTPEEHKAALLEIINKTLSDLGSGAKWRKAPEFLEEYEPLKGKTLVMIDDVKGLLEHFAPNMIVATDGNASFIEYTGQEINALIEQIMQNNPDIVVVDYHLSTDFKGSSVVKALMENQNFAGQVVGFSSDNQTSKKFTDAGAKGAVNKDTGYPEKSVSELASLISK